MKKENKKESRKILRDRIGEMTSSQFVILIILIVSFAIILLMFWIYPWNEEISKDTCHSSVVMRSSFNFGPIEASKEIPLKCKTEKICLSSKGKDCTELGPGSRNDPVEKIRAKTKGEALDVIAQAMYDCHSMLGEGKLDFMARDFRKTNYCLICSRIVFDEETAKSIGNIQMGELYQYLGSKKDPQGRSYLEFLYPGWTNWESAKLIFEAMQKSASDDEINEKVQKDSSAIQSIKKMKFEDWVINTRYPGGYVIIDQMAPEGTWKNTLTMIGIAGGAVLAVVGLAALPVTGALAVVVGLTTKTVIFGAAVGTGYTFWFEHPNGKYQYSPPTLYPYELNALRSINCDTFQLAP